MRLAAVQAIGKLLSEAFVAHAPALVAKQEDSLSRTRVRVRIAVVQTLGEHVTRVAVADS